MSAGVAPLAAGFALGSAVAFAVAAVVQQRAAAQTRSGPAVDPRLLLRLIRRPLWLAGMAATLTGFALQAVALALGRLVLVEPVFATGLLIALPLGAWAGRLRMSRADWWAAVAAAGGLAAFLALAAPAGGQPVAGTVRLMAMVGVATALVAAAILAAVRAVAARRALLLGAGAGLGAGVTDALTKTVATVAGQHKIAVLADPRLYLLAVVGLSMFTIQQNGYRAAGLAASLPAFAVGEPLTGSVLGLVIYHEQLQAPPGQLAAAAVAAIVALCGIALLARSPLVSAGHPAGPPGPGSAP